VLEQWRLAGARATGDASRAKELGLEARCILEEQLIRKPGV
jgi:hypothetical protein